MLFRLFSHKASIFRSFSEIQNLGSLIKSESALTFAPSIDLDFDSIPTYTLSSYDEKFTEILLKYSKSLNSIAGGRFNKNIFDTISVYSFMDHVPLTNSGFVEQLSETTFKVTAFDPSNAPTIEIALKKSPYHMQVQRDFGDITVTMKLDKGASNATALKLVQEAKKKVENIVQSAKIRFKGNVQAIADIEEMGKKIQSDIELVHEEKFSQLNN